MAYENFQKYVAKSSSALKSSFERCSMQITIDVTLPYNQFNEWSKENVKTRMTRSRTREEKRLGKTSSLKRLKHQRHLVRRVTLCKCDGKHCRWHSATCTLCYSNAVAIFII
ncbi:hypothetical protein T08_6278 [Trichinella sp. T8]|nr:hypothetical protein T08_6278 [Trichinella sp. T8]